jgi:hypothetical protein
MQTRKQQLQGGLLLREAAPGGMEVESKGKNLVLNLSFSSEMPYLRTSWFDTPWVEVLGHNPDEINLEHLKKAGSLLLNHDSTALLGTVEGAWVQGGKGYARVRLSRREDLAGVLQDIQDGVLRNCSMGYQIYSRDFIRQTGDGTEEYRATSWAPMEVSLVSVPADPNVGLDRSNERRYFHYRIIEGEHMPEASQNGANSAPNTLPNTLPNPPNLADAERRFREQETTRRTEITQAFSRFLDMDNGKLRDARDLCLNDLNCSAEQARQVLLRKLGEDSVPLGGHTQARDHGGYGDDFIRAAGDAIALRAGVRVKDPHPAAKDLRRHSMKDLAATCLRNAGAMTRDLPATEMVRTAFSHTTSDFPRLMSGAVDRILLAAFETEAQTYRQWTASTEVADFKPQTLIRLSEGPDLLLVREDAEYLHGSFNEEDLPTVKIEKFGRIFSLSMETLVNDDLHAFASVPRLMAQSAVRLEADKIYGLLTENPRSPDGNSFVSLEHGNLAATPAALSIVALGAARAQMRKQRGLNDAYIDPRPAFLLVPVDLESEAEQVVTGNWTPGTPDGTRNAWISSLTVVAEPRLTGKAWYLATSPTQFSPILRVYLTGQEQPFVDQKDGWDVDGTAFKARHLFAAAAVEWRGIFKNPGV